jgi:hypothetical protein
MNSEVIKLNILINFFYLSLMKCITLVNLKEKIKFSLCLIN